ncbi:MAG: universal stress protein [Thermodesulfovibrionales bacterium]|nr:universal stress protein [Thermodesulfovibrionales bacterium]
MDKINRKILIAVDESENSMRAINYVGELLRGMTDFRIFLLHIVLLPQDDYFFNEEEKTSWIREKKVAGEGILHRSHKVLTDFGFKEDSIKEILIVESCSSVGECILQKQQEINCSTVVIGRRGISKKEEFIFGSTSNKILHTPKSCTVWIVE